MFYAIVFVLLGLALLTLGAEGLVRAGVSFALRMGVTPLVIGLTIVAFGTGSPELVVSAQASYFGNSGLALGNVIGSNISNTALILGVASLIFPITAHTDVVRREMPIMVAVTGALWLMIADGELGRVDGVILFTGSIAYTTTIYFLARRSNIHITVSPIPDEDQEPGNSIVLDTVYLIGGLAILVAGAKLLIDGAISIARILEISEVIIALSVVAIGTSLPELATSAVAAIRKESDLALGNAIGSNIFNILCVLGVTALVNPVSAAEIRNFDMAVLMGSALFLWALLGFRFRLDRFEGALLLVGYAIYLYTLAP
ncbi:MAG: calcium/sodium antiporter [Acidobacteriota bacterium]|nr:calcium/sodium antiporter [Acidobacteriota bacterium]MDH3528338.1 calcium/sodium antiporter [Acidobacteriota bacterium]